MIGVPGDRMCLVLVCQKSYAEWKVNPYMERGGTSG